MQKKVGGEDIAQIRVAPDLFDTLPEWSVIVLNIGNLAEEDEGNNDKKYINQARGEEYLPIIVADYKSPKEEGREGNTGIDNSHEDAPSATCGVNRGIFFHVDIDHSTDDHKDCFRQEEEQEEQGWVLKEGQAEEGDNREAYQADECAQVTEAQEEVRQDD